MTPFYYAFLIPVALILIVNIIVYVMVVVNICRRSKRGSGSASSNRAVGIRASVACFIVLGKNKLKVSLHGLYRCAG